jgi:hypothetical protein
MMETETPWTLESLGDSMLELHRKAQPNLQMDGVSVK